MTKAYTYILKCADESYYTGSTKDLERRLEQHQNGEGANHTKKRLPVELIYFEEFDRIDDAYYREKQVQGWNRKKKEALINSRQEDLPELSVAYRDVVASRTSATVGSSLREHFDKAQQPPQAAVADNKKSNTKLPEVETLSSRTSDNDGSCLRFSKATAQQSKATETKKPKKTKHDPK